MKITAIKQQVKISERVNIFVDGKYEFSLSLDELLKEKLKKEQELKLADIKRLKKISAEGKLRARSLEWLLNRPHSEREFRDYLYRKKAEPEHIENLVNEFTAKGYLDNVKFAAWFTELQLRRHKSDKAIRAELYKKGISRDLADDALAKEVSSEQQRLKKIIEKKRKLKRYQENPQKMMQYLAGQGFNWSDIKDALGPGSSEIT